MTDKAGKDAADISARMGRHNMRVNTIMQGPEDFARLKAMYVTPLEQVETNTYDGDSSREVEYDLVDHLAMLLSSVANAAATSGSSNVGQILKEDPHAQAHFAVFSEVLRSTTGVDPSLIEYTRTDGEGATLVICNGEANPAGWKHWKRVV